MNFTEAHKKANEGDKVYNLDFDLWYNKGDVEFNDYPSLKAIVSDAWEIQPKKPEILTADQWIELNLDNIGEGEGTHCEFIFDSGDLNGQRKLYYQGGVKELVEAANNILERGVLDYEHGFYGECQDDLTEALENIQKPE